MAAISEQVKQRSRALRTNQTDAERKLWRYLKDRQVNGWRFRRQHPIAPYVVDFACIETKLIVEADGGQHATASGDPVRDERLREKGWRIMRFWNPNILKSISGIIETIADALGPPPRAAWGRGI